MAYVLDTVVRPTLVAFSETCIRAEYSGLSTKGGSLRPPQRLIIGSSCAEINSKVEKPWTRSQGWRKEWQSVSECTAAQVYSEVSLSVLR